MMINLVLVMVHSSSLSQSLFLLFSVAVSSYDDDKDDDLINYNAEDDTYLVELSHQECVYL